MLKTVRNYGLIAGAILSVMMLISLAFHEQIGFEYSAIVGYSTMVLAFLMVFFGVKSYRDHEVKGDISFLRALALGLMISLVASSCYVATWQLVYHKLAPDFVDKYADYELRQAEKSGATEAEMVIKRQGMAGFMESYKNPLFNVAITFLEPLPVGLIFSVFSAGVLCRKRSSTRLKPTEARPV